MPLAFPALTLGDNLEPPRALGAFPEIAHGAAPVEAVTRAEDGQVVGLGRAFHAGRREALRQRVETGWILITGLPRPEAYQRFTQDKTFWYFTGIDSPEAALLMNAQTGEEILFLPPYDARHERWDGPQWDADDPWVSDLTGIDTVISNRALVDELRERLGDEDRIAVTTYPDITTSGALDLASPFLNRQRMHPLDGRPSRRDAKFERLQQWFPDRVDDITSDIVRLRWIKQPQEIEAMRRAALSGARGLAEGMRSTRPGRGEWEIEAVMTMVHTANGATGPAYGAIVGSGPNSCVLHYMQSSRRMQDGELLLVDYGPEVDFYTTDITRTWPVNGRFTDEQARMYDIVLEAQQAGINAAGPGRSFGDIQRAINQVFRRNGVMDLVRHGPSHFIGMEVHDVGNARRLAPGMVLTVEPGLYDESRNMGIRIEDVIVITESGREILTRAIPVEREAIEAIMAEPGLLDLHLP